MSGIDVDIEKFVSVVKESNESLIEFFADFDKAKYKPSDLGISARMIGYWNKKDLLFENENGWHRFNIHQAVWVKIVDELRALNLSIKAIKKIKSSLFLVPDYTQVYGNSDVFDKLKSALESKDMHEIAASLNQEELQIELRKNQVTVLQLILVDLIAVRSNYRILFNTDGEVMLHKDNYEDELKNVLGYLSFMKTTHISISLNSVLFSITKNVVEDKDLKRLHILKDKELEILEATRSKGVKKVEITFSDESKPELIKVTKVNKLDTASRVKELLLSNGYQDIRITTQKGNVVHYENTTKTKL